MEHGEYAHFLNWEQGLINTVNAVPQLQQKKINIMMNIDGIPVFRNSVKYTAYPILLKVIENPCKVIVVGVYCSNKTTKLECQIQS